MSHTLSLTEDPRWQAVLNRDPAFDNAFVYGVASTGIYCRSVCPARRPKRESVRFFDTPAEAVTAGFRACKRCKPDGEGAAQQQAAMITRLCRLIETAEQAPSLEGLATEAGLSPFHLHRVFKAVTGVTPKAYARAHRSQRMRESLKTSASVTEAIYEAGFNASSRFYADTQPVLGMTPSAFRAGGTNEVIRFAVGQSSLGAILVAMSQKGVCAVFLGDDPEALMRELQDAFPKAQLVGADGDFEALVAQVVALVEAPKSGLDLPLDIRGTAFQQRVWQALRTIPAGERLSYRQLAQRIGAPSAVRAVASACAANRIAIAIPCHRVVRTDGALSGYRWGIARKDALLRREYESD